MKSKSLDKLKKDCLNQLQADADEMKKMIDVGEAILGKASNAMLARISKNINTTTSNHLTMGFIKENVHKLKEEYDDICNTIEGIKW